MLAVAMMLVAALSEPASAVLLGAPHYFFLVERCIISHLTLKMYLQEGVCQCSCGERQIHKRVAQAGWNVLSSCKARSIIIRHH